MAPALVRRNRMNLIDDHGPGGCKHPATGIRSEQDVKRFRSGDDDMRRSATHALALSRRRIAGTHPAANIDVGQALLAQHRTDLRYWNVQIFSDVVRQRLERRDVDDLD